MSLPLLSALALLVGLLSSFHCIGMCGGIMGALTYGLPQAIRADSRQLTLFLLAYNSGRLLSYVLAGLVLGAFGAAMMDALAPWFGLEWPRLLAGVVMLLIGLNIAGWLPQLALLEHIGQPLWRWMQPLHHRLTPVTSLRRALLYGLVWGWLPCGVVYAMLITAMAQNSALIGGWLMLAFGMGTLPSVVATGLLAGRIQGMVRKPMFRRFAGLTVILFGLMALVSSWAPSPGASLLTR